MTEFEKKTAYYLNLFFGYLLASISIIAFVLVFKIQPIFNYFISIYPVEKVHFIFALLPGIFSGKCFRNIDKLKLNK